MITWEDAENMTKLELLKDMLRVQHREKDDKKATVICNWLYNELCGEEE